MFRMMFSALTTAVFVVAAVAVASTVAPQPGLAAEAEVRSMTRWPKPSRSVNKQSEKLCRHKFPNGEKAAWICDKAVPCCAWDEIQYVKCGTTFTGCL